MRPRLMRDWNKRRGRTTSCDAGVGGRLPVSPRGAALPRLEYAIDEDGFWLEPHTDIGIKKFTYLISFVDYNN